MATATGALLLPLGLAQAPASEEPTPQDPLPRGLERVDPQEDRGVPSEQRLDSRLDAERLITLLTVEDLDQREVHFDEVVRMARRDRGALKLLDEIASSRLDLDLAWTARLALREVKGGGSQRSRNLYSRNPGDPLDSFPSDLFSDLHLRGLEGLDPLGMRGMLAVPPGSATQSRSVQIERDEKGMRLRITEMSEGEEDVVREYRGESLDAIFEANPELREEIQIETGRIPDGTSFRFRMPGVGTNPDWEKILETMRSRSGNDFFRIRLEPGAPSLKEFLTPQRFTTALRTDRLGVRVAEVPAKRMAELSLVDDIGLYVHSTVPGTIAYLLQVGPGDVLLQIDDVVLRVGDDIDRALLARQPSDPLTLSWIDALGEKHTRTWTPEAPKVPEPPVPQKPSLPIDGK